MVLSIELEDNQWVYSPGQTIKGKVVINKNIWNKVEGLSIRFYGRIEILTGTGNEANDNMVPLAAGSTSAQQRNRQSNSYGCIGTTTRRLLNKNKPFEDVLIDHTTNLIDSWKVLKPGRHEFDFSYEIPNNLNLPASMKVNGARVHYEFVTSLKRPRDDYKIYQTPFYISSNLDQYLDEDFNPFLCPTERRADKKLYSCFECCSGGTFGFELKLERRVCCVGERFCFVITVWNEMKKSLDSISVQLVREFKYTKGPTYSTKEIISEVSGPGVPSGENQVWNGSLQIPNTTPGTNMRKRDSTELNYYVKVVLYPINRPSKRISLKCLLILLPVNAFSALITRPIPPPPSYSQGPSLDEDNHNLPPPTYEEATQSNFTKENNSSRQLGLGK